MTSVQASSWSVQPLAALDRVHEVALDRVARRERDVVAALHHARAAAFAEQALHRDVTRARAPPSCACSAANSPAPPEPRIRMSVERVASAVIRRRRHPSPQGRANSRDRASGVGIAAKRLPTPARARGADVAVAAVPHPARGSRPEFGPPLRGGRSADGVTARRPRGGSRGRNASSARRWRRPDGRDRART